MEPRDLSSHAAFRPGGGAEEPADLGAGGDDVVRLDHNANPLGPSPAAVEAIRESAERVHSYPTASHADLRAALADRWDVADEQIWLAAGGTGALDYLSRAFLDPGQRVLRSKPGLSYTAMSARYHGGEADAYRLERSEDFAFEPETVLGAYDGQRIVFVTTPHNPTGSEMALADVETIADETDDGTLVVVDEAYGPFSDEPSAVSLVGERDDVAVIRTLSKAHGLAGLRLGYVVTPSEWAGAYARVNTPFAVSETACRAGLAALNDDEHVEQTVELARWGRDYLREHLDAPTWESGGNFVLADVGDASAVTEACESRGVLVRDCTSRGLPGCVRISCGTRAETERAVETINDALAERSP